MIDDNERLNLLLELGRYADAERSAREAIGRNPQWAAGYTHLARALMGLNKKDPALDAAREGAGKAPHDAWAVSVLAYTLNWLDMTQLALEAAEQAVALDPQYTWAYVVLAGILHTLGRFQEVRAKAAEGLRVDPLCENLIRWKGWAEHELRMQDDALRTAEEGLRHHPNSHQLLNLAGCVRWAQAEKVRGRARLRLHRAADAMFRAAMSRDPTRPEYHGSLRGNARSCRGYLVNRLLLVACLVLSVAPAVALGAATLDPASGALELLVAVSFVVLVGFIRGELTERAALVAPLRLFDVPTVPLEPRERRRGLFELFVHGVPILMPYVILVAWFRG